MNRVGTLTVHLQRYILRITTILVIISILEINAKPLISRDEPVDHLRSNFDEARTPPGTYSVPLFRRSSSETLKEDDYGTWVRTQGEFLNAKYGGSTAKHNSALRARTNGTTYLLNRMYRLFTM